MNCPGFEALSAFADGESPPAESVSIDQHLSGCAVCRRAVESIAAERRALSSLPVPPMPGDLKRSLEAMSPRTESVRRRWLAEIWAYRTATAHPLLFREGAAPGPSRGPVRVSTLAIGAAAACLALFLWARHAGVFSPGPEIPAEFFAAAHNQYALSLRLAPSEEIMSEMPARLSAGIPEDRDVY